MRFEMSWATLIMVLCVALGTIGAVQYLKDTFKKVTQGWVWRLAMPAVAAGIAAAFWYLPPFIVVWILAIFFTQLGWDCLFKMLIDLVKRRFLPPAGEGQTGG